jgi:hypothetical protein
MRCGWETSYTSFGEKSRFQFFQLAAQRLDFGLAPAIAHRLNHFRCNSKMLFRLPFAVWFLLFALQRLPFAVCLLLFDLQPARLQMIIRQMQFHLPAFGNFSRFFEIAPGWGKFILRTIAGAWRAMPLQLAL